MHMHTCVVVVVVVVLVVVVVVVVVEVALSVLGTRLTKLSCVNPHLAWLVGWLTPQGKDTLAQA